jgi:hypothetical protein
MSIINFCAKWVPKSVYAALLALMIAGCSKNEQAIEQWSFTSLQLKAITVDALMLRVMANETLLTDSLYTPGNKAIDVQYFNPIHRFLVTDLYSKTLLLDTVVEYKAGAVNSITFFQSLSGGKLVRIGPPANEPLPPAGKIKISIVYGNEELPDQVKVIVEDSELGNTTYAATDSFLLKKGAFSPYFIGKQVNGRKPQLKFYTTDARRKLVAKVQPSAFNNTNTDDFSIYSFNSIESIDQDGSFYLKREKLY